MLPQYEYRRFCRMDDELNPRTVGDAIIALEKHVEKLYELLGEKDTQLSPVASPEVYGMRLFDRADGVKGHYSIGRRIDGGIYWEFYCHRDGSWMAVGTLYRTKQEAVAMLTELVSQELNKEPTGPNH